MVSKDRLRILRETQLFSQVPEELLEEIADGMETVRLQPDQNLFKKGDIGRSMYIIQSGRVKVHDGDLVFNELETGAIFGEMAALDPEVRSASVTAVEETELFKIDQESLFTVIEGDINAVQVVIHILSQNLRNRLKDMARDYEYIQQVYQIADSAQAIEAGSYQPGNLDSVAKREDELGQLARVFQSMAKEVYAREQRFKQQVQELRIELDEAKQRKQVEEIVETDYFKKLREQAESMRKTLNERR